jgi:hypothetical protein
MSAMMAVVVPVMTLALVAGCAPAKREETPQAAGALPVRLDVIFVPSDLVVVATRLEAARGGPNDTPATPSTTAVP